MTANRIGGWHRGEGALPTAARAATPAGQAAPTRRWGARLHAALALFGAPLGWSVQMGITAGHVRFSCAAPGAVVSSVSLSSMQDLALAGSAGCAAFALCGTVLAWRDLWRTCSVPWDGPLSARHVREERAWLVARISALVSTMCLIGLVAADLSVLVGSACLAA